MTILAFFTNNGEPQTGLTPTIRVREVESGDLAVTDASMTEVGDGFYKYLFTEESDTDYAIRCDGGSEIPSSERYVYAGTELTDIYQYLVRILGLSQENYKLTNTVYNISGNMTSGKLKIYPSATDCNNDTNAIAEYQITATYNGEGLVSSYKVVKL